MTVICLAALGLALFASRLVDQGEESTGRSALAREAREFAMAIEGRSSDVLDYLTDADKRNPRAIQQLRSVLSSLRPNAELMVSRVTLGPGAEEGASEILVARPTARGSVPEDKMLVSWVRSPGGEWKARVFAP